MILITGGTGLVGAHLLAYLSRKHTNLRAIYRSKSSLETVEKVFSYYDDTSDFTNIEWIRGDITDIPLMEKAFVDVTHVYHAAALISFDPKDFDELRKTNIEGTANIVNLCIAHNVEKLCFVSSVAAVGENEDVSKPITEETYWNPEADNNVYAISKYGAEMEVWRGSQEGLDVVIVNPAIILGEGFWYSGSGSLFRRIDAGLQYYTNGILGFVDVQDVVSTMILLMESDQKNERFLLVGDNWSFKKFANIVADELECSPPKKEANAFLLNIAWRFDWWRQLFTGRRRRITRLTAKSLLSESFYDSSKVKKTLDFTFTPIEETIERVGYRYADEKKI